jgi:hypothetical protein
MELVVLRLRIIRRFIFDGDHAGWQEKGFAKQLAASSLFPPM